MDGLRDGESTLAYWDRGSNLIVFEMSRLVRSMVFMVSNFVSVALEVAVADLFNFLSLLVYILSNFAWPSTVLYLNMWICAADKLLAKISTVVAFLVCQNA